MFKEQYLTLLL